ncbi:uncharacterized protein LOC135491957 [Lineus longissimus]|uniref:uncharacterized protein LOC135491957 n=1 Tax=Lineus longissimus TaxID=88925 RepID=UPI002B4EEDFE
MAETPSVQQLLDYQTNHPNKLFPDRSESPQKTKVTPRSKQLRYFQKQNPGKLFPGPSATPDTSAETPTKRLLYYQRENPNKLFAGPTDSSVQLAEHAREGPISNRTQLPSKSSEAPLTVRQSLDELIIKPVLTPAKSPGSKDRDLFKKTGIKLKPQQIPIWSPSKPDSILLYKPSRGDDLEKLKRVADDAIGKWYPGNSQISAITTTDRHPKPLTEWKEDDPHGLSVLFIPKGALDLKVEVQHHNRYLDIDLKWMIPIKATQSMKVSQLKQEIEKIEGFPVKQQDLLFKDRCLQNKERLYTYRLNNHEPIELILQPQFDLSITVQTFWKKDYTLRLDRCVRVKEVIGATLWELFMDKGSKQTVFLVKSLVRQNILCLDYQGCILPNLNGLMLHKVQNGSFLNLWPVNRDSNVMSQLVELKMDYEGRHEFQVPVAPSDTWVVVAMKAFKVTRIPIDMMKLITKKGPVDLNASVGFTQTNKHHVTIVVNEQFDRWSYQYHQVKICYRGIKRHLHFNVLDTVADIKHCLACTGFHQAKYYTFFVGQIPLKENTVISGLDLKKGDIIELELEVFPFFVHLQGKEYTLLEEHQLTTLDKFQKGVFQQINRQENIENVLVHCGQILRNDSTSLFTTTIGVNSVFFIDIESQCHNLEFRRPDHKKFYLTLPKPANGEIIWDIVKKCKYLYDNSKYAVVLLLNWLLTPREKEANCLTMLQDPHTRPRRKDPLQPKRIAQHIWEEFKKDLSKSKRPKEKLNSDGLPVILDPDEELRNRKLKEWPFETAQPRWVKFPALPSQTGSLNDTQKRIQDEEYAKKLFEQQSKKRRKVHMYDKSLQVDMDKVEEQEDRRRRKAKKIKEDSGLGQMQRLFTTREEREAFERAQLEAQGLLEEEEEEEEGDKEEGDGEGVGDGEAEGEAVAEAEAEEGEKREEEKFPLKDEVAATEDEGEEGPKASENNGENESQQNGAEGNHQDGAEEEKAQVDESTVEAQGEGQRKAPNEKVVNVEDETQREEAGGEGSQTHEDEETPEESPPKEREVDDFGRPVPTTEGEPEPRVMRQRDAPVERQPPATSRGLDEEDSQVKREVDETGRQAPTRDGKPEERKPQQKRVRIEPRNERGEGVKRDMPEEDNDEEGPAGDLDLPRKSISADTLLAIQKKLRKRRQTLGLVLHDSEFSEDVGKEYEQKDKMVVDRSQVTSEDDRTSFVRILYPRRIRAAIYEELDAEPAKPRKGKKTNKKVKFVDEDEKRGYWRPILPIVNYHDHPIWEYRPSFQVQLELKEQAANDLEKQQHAEQLLKEAQEKKENARKPAKKKTPVAKEDKAIYGLTTEEKETEKPRTRGSDVSQPAKKTTHKEEETESVTVSLDKPGRSDYKKLKENEKRQWMDIEEVPKYDRKKARERQQQNKRESQRPSRSGGKTTANGEPEQTDDQPRSVEPNAPNDTEAEKTGENDKTNSQSKL